MRSIKDKIVLAFLFGWPLIDVANGALVYYGNDIGSISAAYKSLFFIILLLFLAGHFASFKKAWTGLLFYLAIILCVIHHYFFWNISTESIAWAIRALLAISIYLYFARNNNSAFGKVLYLYMPVWYLFVAGLNVILGNLGIGEPQYSNGVGGKGFFIAGNELSFFMLASVSILFFNVANKVKFPELLLLVFGISLVFTLQGTKTTLAGFLCVVGFVSIYLYAKPLKLFKGAGLVSTALLAIAIIMKGPDGLDYLTTFQQQTSFSAGSLVEGHDTEDSFAEIARETTYDADASSSSAVSDMGSHADEDSLSAVIREATEDATRSSSPTVSDIESHNDEDSFLKSPEEEVFNKSLVVEEEQKSPSVFDRWEYFARKKGIAFLILSGRSDFWDVAYDEKVSSFSPLDYVLGVGGDAFDIHRIEMDPFDIFVVYGVLGLFVFYFLIYRMFYCAFRIFSYSPKEGGLLLAISFLFFAVSIVAGHVVNSGVSSSVLAVAALYYEERRKINIMASI